MDNQPNEKKISVDELLKKKRERNEKNKNVVRDNFQKRNEAIAQRHGQNTEELLLGEAQIDLQNRLYDAEDMALIRFNDNYIKNTNKILADNDAEADREAERINSAIDVDYQVLEVKEEFALLPPRRTRFTNTLLASAESSEETLLLPAVPLVKKPNKFTDNLPEL